MKRVDRVIFVKSILGRKPKFSIRTTARIERGLLRFVKTPLTPSAVPHLARMMNAYEQFAERGMARYFCPPSQTAQGEVVFPAVEGVSLEEELLTAVLANDRTKTDQLLSCYEELLQQLSQPTAVAHAENMKIFGDRLTTFSADSHIFPGAMDIGFDNIVLTPTPIVIDYEWTFPGSVPTQYVLCRALMIFASRYNVLFRHFSTRVPVIGFGEDYALPRVIVERYPDFLRYLTQCVAIEEQGFRPYVEAVPPIRKALPRRATEIRNTSPTFFTQRQNIQKEADHLNQEVGRLHGVLRKQERAIRALRTDLGYVHTEYERVVGSLRYKIGFLFLAPGRLLLQLVRRSRVKD